MGVPPFMETTISPTEHGVLFGRYDEELLWNVNGISWKLDIPSILGTYISEL